MKKILIVDDQKTILITLEAILKQQGYQVFAATNSIDAFDKFNKNEDYLLSIIIAAVSVGMFFFRRHFHNKYQKK